MTVEESNDVVYLDVIRSLGSMDQISVDLVTQSASARSVGGMQMYLASVQQV